MGCGGSVPREFWTESGATYYIVETKGLEDVNVVNKDRAAKLWCDNTTRLTGKPWDYLKVLQPEFTRLQPTSFSDLLVLKPS
jgi:type III restriction enzyme